MRFVQTLETIVTAVFRLLVGLAFLVLIGAVLMQVVGRLSGASPVWTEELSRFALLYLAAIGAGLALRSGDLVNVDIVCEALPERVSWVLRLISALLVAGIGLYLLPMAWQFTRIGHIQTSPALGLRMSFVHATMFVMLALLAFFAILRVVGMLTGAEDGRANNFDLPQED
ncbi:TRAP transporter small permease [Paracoccus sp. TK19116]|uniref:TRAP transporter small permease protein n=1 Tax=Paracoccus albicereus TaxID=2922394 RepID=A0ABT1MZ26_9RHOB|nr:TRAP transporter small permease [Paracoccus albicereus]MCQ0972121.1 TRAP transporter small permease [Paracoccus albicereus]